MSAKKLPISAWVAFVVLSIVWGTTYLGIKVGVSYFPPFFFSAFRHLVAGSIFIVPFLLRGYALPSRSDFMYSAAAGIFMITGGNALLSWAEIYISSGMASILSALAPLFITVLSIIIFKGFRITPLILIGLGISIGGIVILSKPDVQDIRSEHFVLGIVLTCLANLSWGFGSITMKKYTVTLPVLYRTGVQMVSGGGLNLLISLLFEPLPNFAQVPANVWWAFGYLVVFGSLVGYTSYVYVLRYMPPARAAVHTYINTIVAVLVGWWLAGEHLTWLMFGAMCIVLIGVLIVNREYARHSY